MNIIFVFDGLRVGGIERVGVDYLRLLAARGHRVSAVNLMPELNNLYRELPENSTIYEFRLPRTMVPYRYAGGLEKGVRGAIAYAGVASCLAAVNYVYKLSSVKLRRALSDTDVVIAFSGHFNDLMFVASGFIPGKKIAWLHGSEYEYKMLSDGYFALYRKIKNLVCLSEQGDITCRKFNEENGINKVLIYNPVMIQEREIDREKVERLRTEFGNFALMAGRLDPDKDQKTAILAIKCLNEKRNEAVHLLLAGDGVNRQMLEAFVKEQGADRYVHFLGNCLDMQNYYAAAYVYVHSSPMEGLPTVLLEAMTYEVPIAATDSIPGVREILGDNRCGLISPVGDWEALGDHIEKLYEDAELRARLKEAGTERVKDFAPEIAIGRLEEFIGRI